MMFDFSIEDTCDKAFHVHYFFFIMQNIKKMHFYTGKTAFYNISSYVWIFHDQSFQNLQHTWGYWACEIV